MRSEKNGRKRSNFFIRLAYPDMEFKDVAVLLKEVIDSGWLTKGPKTEELEETACKYLKIEEAIAVSSGTAALHISLLSLGIKKGDEVIVPDFTFPAAANTVELCGAKAVLADIDRDSLNIDPGNIVEKITRKTRAIIAVHQFGNPACMSEIMQIAKKRNLSVIEDAACAFGARYRGAMCGTIGELGCFSFHPRKIITTGEGGLIVTDNSKLARLCRRLREHGIEQVGSKKVFTAPGFNYRISEIASAMGLSQLSRIEDIIERRSALARQYREVLEASGGFYALPAATDKENRRVYQSFIAALDKEFDVFGLISFLRSRDIEAAMSNVAIHTQPYYARKYHLRNKDFKNSLWAYRRCVALPFHTRMRMADLVCVASALRDYVMSLA